MTSDPFATSSSLRSGDNPSGGRYRLPDLTIGANGELITGTESKKGGWQRVTTLVSAISDRTALSIWQQRKLLIGLVLRPDLYDLACAALSGVDLMDPDHDVKDELGRLTELILAASGADIGANTGTALHKFAEAQDAGLIHYARARWKGKLSNYADGLSAQGLRILPEYSERRVVILKYGLAGRIDGVAEDLIAGTFRIVDLKTQKKFWTWMEIAAQLAAYQMADAMWDRARGMYVDMPPLADDLAVVSWMPVARDEVEFFDVDLVGGRRVLDLCGRVDAERKAAGSVKQTLGLLRPAPALGLVETYARRMRDVSTLAEGSALWAEIATRGLDGVPELLDTARDAVRRLS